MTLTVGKKLLAMGLGSAVVTMAVAVAAWWGSPGFACVVTSRGSR